ncbi:MAG TPA: hypothetical protein QGF05_08630, partial [Dehalococcoidia bacterium]|nr:hypothetical protein [Dehalococcoidia bacterium]
LLHLSEGVDAVVPRTLDGYHPLCAVYSHRCAAPIRRRLDAGTLRVIDALADLDVREVEPNEVATFDAHGALLLNVNTPDDHEHADQVARSMREE